MKTGIEIIADERRRQVEKEGWTFQHDDCHTNGELALAGAYYALTDDMRWWMDGCWGSDEHLHIWPFAQEWLKLTPNDRIRELAKAGALIAAEIDRLQRQGI